MNHAHVLGIAVAAYAALGCDRVSTVSVPNTAGADRLWASDNMFCARKPNALLCWEAAQGNPIAHEPTLFEGVGAVTALALRQGEGCAISDLGMGCFRLGDKTLARGGAGAPQEFVAFGTAKRMFCAKGADGVQCFTDKIEDTKPYPVFEKPRLIRATLDGAGICAEYEYELRCFTVDAAGALLPTLRVRGVSGVRSVRIQSEPASVLVLDEAGLKFKTATAEAVRGRTLTDDKDKSFPASATVEAELVKSVTDAKKLTSDASATYVLDAQGVKEVKQTDKGIELQLWPLEFVPADFWQARDGAFLAAHQGELTLQGWKGGKRYSRVVKGVKNPKEAASGELYTCIAHDGGVSCFANSEQ